MLFDPDATESRKLWVNRLSTVAVEVIPLIQGILGGLVQFIVLLQAALIGASFSIPVLVGLNWQRANLWGAILGMIGGFVTVIVCLLSLLVGSYSTSPPENERLERFFDI